MARTSGLASAYSMRPNSDMSFSLKVQPQKNFRFRVLKVSGKSAVVLPNADRWPPLGPARCCQALVITPQENAAVKPTPITINTRNQPKTTAKAVPVLTLLMQVMPIAAITRVQIVKTSNDLSNAFSTGEVAGSTKYPGLVATGF